MNGVIIIKSNKLSRNKHYAESIKIYEKIAERQKSILSLIAKNNLAVIYAEKILKYKNELKSLLNILKNMIQ
jgi:lipopolysaccharide biosynthesis regulator YciM